eukprot:765239-Hanusia_phi.AAC.3
MTSGMTALGPGNGYHATNYGATFGAGRRGFGAAQFSSASTLQYMQMSNTIDIGNIQQTSGITLSFWVFATSSTVNNNHIIDFGGGAWLSNVIVGWQTGGLLYFFAFAGTNPGSQLTLGTFGTSTWLHVVCSATSSSDFLPNKWSVWVNNNMVCNKCYTNQVGIISTASSRNWYIGKGADAGTTLKLDGKIDDVRLYNFPFTQFDVEQHYFPLFYPTGCNEVAYNNNPLYAFYPELVASKGFPGVTDLNGAASVPVATWDDAFRQLVSSNKYATIVRVCYDCLESHRLIFYKRILTVDGDWSISQNMLYRWLSNRNTLNVHFKLYGSEVDYLTDNNAWGYCNYDDNAVGSFRDCGPTAAVGSQWTATTGVNAGSSKKVAFYLLKDCQSCAGDYTTTVRNASSVSQCGCGIGYYDDATGNKTCSRCPHMKTTAGGGKTAIAECVPYARVGLAISHGRLSSRSCSGHVRTARAGRAIAIVPNVAHSAISNISPTRRRRPLRAGALDTIPAAILVIAVIADVTRRNRSGGRLSSAVPSRADLATCITRRVCILPDGTDSAVRTRVIAVITHRTRITTPVILLRVDLGILQPPCFVACSLIRSGLEPQRQGRCRMWNFHSDRH